MGLALGSLLLVGAGCAAKTTVTSEVGAPSDANQGANPGTGEPNRGGNVPPAVGMMPAKKLVATIAAQGGSNQSGAAELTETNGKTTVTITISGEPAGANEPAHIHVGSCPNPGAVVWPLSAVIEGKSVTTLDVPLAEMIAKFPLSINVHKSATELGVYEACGNLSYPSDQPSAGAGASAGAGVSGNAGGANANVNVSVNGNLGLDPGPTLAPKEVRITAKQFTFSPAEVRVKQGEKVRLVVTSTDVEHGMSIPAFNVNLNLVPGKTVTTEFVADQKGSFPFFCSVFCGSGHGSMRGTLIVE